eukprot:TRINITY_DN3265_c0_g1_i1.p1 TRINITY_DN3265_c0_g1~~TRINITY_DN3265_c0_g1_i1.p1  ORF type:complete len:300 (-),score=69.96 TRINITY_DN3265_c0_g1_i1:792-1691(-)
MSMFPLYVAILIALFYLVLFIRRHFQTVSIHKVAPAFDKTKVSLGKHASVHSIQGRRDYMEDTFQAMVNIEGDEKCAYFGVYDGHGGCHAAEYTAAHLHSLLIKQPNFREQPVASLKHAFQQLDNDWLSIAENQGFDDGTTVLGAFITNGVLYVANAGDSRAVLVQRGRPVMMSVDHKPSRLDEKERVEKLGGHIVLYGTWRVEGILAVTRSVGDRRLKTYVIPTPEVASRPLDASDDFLILATDGLWDVMANAEAAEIVATSESVEAAAQRLTRIASDRGSMDNITSMVINLRPFRRG